VVGLNEFGPDRQILYFTRSVAAKS
jgi:hypothetical protein